MKNISLITIYILLYKDTIIALLKRKLTKNTKITI